VTLVGFGRPVHALQLVDFKGAGVGG
jgi:hypothetical protein